MQPDCLSTVWREYTQCHWGTTHHIPKIEYHRVWHQWVRQLHLLLHNVCNYTSVRTASLCFARHSSEHLQIYHDTSLEKPIAHVLTEVTLGTIIWRPGSTSKSDVHLVTTALRVPTPHTHAVHTPHHILPSAPVLLTLYNTYCMTWKKDGLYITCLKLLLGPEALVTMPSSIDSSVLRQMHASAAGRQVPDRWRPTAEGSAPPPQSCAACGGCCRC